MVVDFTLRTSATGGMAWLQHEWIVEASQPPPTYRRQTPTGTARAAPVSSSGSMPAGAATAALAAASAAAAAAAAAPVVRKGYTQARSFFPQIQPQQAPGVSKPPVSARGPMKATQQYM